MDIQPVRVVLFLGECFTTKQEGKANKKKQYSAGNAVAVFFQSKFFLMIFYLINFIEQYIRLDRRYKDTSETFVEKDNKVCKIETKFFTEFIQNGITMFTNVQYPMYILL